MPAIEVNGREIYSKIIQDVREKVSQLRERGIKIKLFIVALGEDKEMELYIRNKKKASQLCGIQMQEIYLPADTQETELAAKIYELNNDQSITGFIVQLPLPPHINKNVLDLISPSKDVDCLTSVNLGQVIKDHVTARFIPCACQSMLDVFELYSVDVRGKIATVVGASDLIGKPCAAVLVNLGATTIVCHKYTTDLAEYVKQADIVVSAVGIPGIIKGEWIKPGAVVIDIGTRIVDGKVMGDVEYNVARQRASLITPVPGGIGIITVAELMKNVLKAFYYSNSSTTF